MVCACTTGGHGDQRVCACLGMTTFRDNVIIRVFTSGAAKNRGTEEPKIDRPTQNDTMGTSWVAPECARGRGRKAESSDFVC
jgi:hypothetical protein